MLSSRNLLGTMFFAAAITLLGVRASWAQEGAPDPRMLLNLDLFASASNQTAPADGASYSMLDQIQTLRAMGYLNGRPMPAPQPAQMAPPPPPPPPPQPPYEDENEE
jgi:hypothetical protein